MLRIAILNASLSAFHLFFLLYFVYFLGGAF